MAFLLRMIWYENRLRIVFLCCLKLRMVLRILWGRFVAVDSKTQRSRGTHCSLSTILPSPNGSQAYVIFARIFFSLFSISFPDSLSFLFHLSWWSVRRTLSMARQTGQMCGLNPRMCGKSKLPTSLSLLLIGFLSFFLTFEKKPFIFSSSTRLRSDR